MSGCYFYYEYSSRMFLEPVFRSPPTLIHNQQCILFSFMLHVCDYVAFRM